MKHQSLIEHLNLPPGYNTEIAEEAIYNYIENVKRWYKAEGWEEGYFSRDKEIIAAKVLYFLVGIFAGMLLTAFISTLV